MEPLTWATEVPKEWSEFKQACSEEEPCPGMQTCMSERSIYVWEAHSDTEWSTGFGCYNDATRCDGGYAETEYDDHEDDGSYSYWESQCDLHFLTANSGATKSASIAALASLIAFSMALF